MKCRCHSHGGLLLGSQLDLLRPTARAEEEGLTLDELHVSLDILGSVSASELDLIFDDVIIDQQYRRFHNGSS